MKNSTLAIPITVIFAIVLFLFVLTRKSGRTVQQQAQIIDSLQTKLSYYQDTYHYRVGTIHDEYGTPQTIRALSIDDGKNWLIISQNREVQGHRYLHIAYPDINPDSLKKVY